MTDKKKDRPFVFVRCMTFNHEAYIKDALNGFVMQQTNFPFVVAIVDDASTDDNVKVIERFIKEHCECEADYIKEEIYGRVIKTTVKNNPNCILCAVLLYENHYRKKAKRPYYAQYEDAAKYIAMCEGDDYWTDPLKLQKQVDFMEANPEYSMCFHKVDVLSSDDKDIDLYDHLCEREYSAHEIYDRWTIPTCSILYNQHKLKLIQPKRCIFGDIVLFLSLANGGKLFCLDFIGGVYRRHAEGVSSSYSNDTLRNLYHQYQEMITLFPEVRDISIKNRNEYLKCVIHDKTFKGTWKYRLHYMWLNKHLFFSRFALATIKYLFV